jgi:hypothetical protein
MVDENTIVSLHTYDPVPYSMDCNPNSWGSVSDTLSIINNLKSQQSMVASKHGTAIIGEWGTKGCDNQDSRVKHAFFYARQCRNFGMLPVWWDDGGDFHLLNRKTNPPSWDYPAIAQAIVDGAKAGNFPNGIGIRPGKGRSSFAGGLKLGAGVVRSTLREAAPVSMRLLTAQGEVVWSLAPSFRAAGNHEAALPMKAIDPGHYILEFQAGKKGIAKNVVTY